MTCPCRCPHGAQSHSSWQLQLGLPSRAIVVSPLALQYCYACEVHNTASQLPSAVASRSLLDPGFRPLPYTLCDAQCITTRHLSAVSTQEPCNVHLSTQVDKDIQYEKLFEEIIDTSIFQDFQNDGTSTLKSDSRLVSTSYVKMASAPPKYSSSFENTCAASAKSACTDETNCGLHVGPDPVHTPQPTIAPSLIQSLNRVPVVPLEFGSLTIAYHFTS